VTGDVVPAAAHFQWIAIPPLPPLRCQDARRVLVTSATRMLDELRGPELHGQLERTGIQPMC
jgi:hypothetical protein